MEDCICTDAMVYHSHAYSVGQDYGRYVQIGRFHAALQWLIERFGTVGGEGMRFMRSQLRMLSQEAPVQIVGAVVRAASKWIGYKLGLRK